MFGSLGPDHPEPFPSTGDLVKFLRCPVCRNNGLLYWFAPTELAYETKCIKCDCRQVVHETGMSMTELQEQGVRGHSSQLDGYRKPSIPKVEESSPVNQYGRQIDMRALSANDWWEDVLERGSSRMGLDWWKR